MTDATAAEIFEWALVNRARLDPAGETARAGLSNINEGPVLNGPNGSVVTLSTTSLQPLAWNDALGAVADQHNADMLARNAGLYHDAQAVHEQAMTNAGYSFRGWGENVSESGTFSGGDQTAEMNQHELQLFNDSFSSWRGHRGNLENGAFQEIGISASIGTIDGANRSIITEDFGTPSAAGQFLTGIAYNDTNHDAFYSIGEGQSGITVATTAGNISTATAGNFSKAISAGVQTVTFSGGDLTKAVSVSIDVAAGRNALVDMVDQSTVETSVSLTALANVTKIIGLGNNGITLTGNGLDNTIVTALGNDTLNGGDGVDTAVFAGTKASYTIVTNADGTRTVSGHGQTDQLTSIEKIQFDDQLVDFTPAPTPIVGSIVISDATITEGNSGTKIETFTVTRTGGSAAFDVNFATADRSATTADGDYVAKSGALHFAAGVNSQTISVVINGDTKVEANDTFSVNLSGATNGATMSDAQGIGTIFNDDATAPAPVAGSVVISNASVTEGNSGSQIETFTVTRSGGSAAFDVNYATANGTATTADGDYVAKSGVLHFAAGVNTQTISVVVNGDTKIEANETFSVNLSGATGGATVSHAQGVGTIVNNDAAPTATHHVTNDFNGDGASDILFNNNATGGIAVWELDGNHVALDAVVGTVAGWHVDGAGDFNNDGKADMLLQNAAGTLVMWQMNGASVASSTVIGSVASGWHFADAADFNGDGKADILWQNDDGRLVEWQMNGASVTSSTVVGTPGAGWHFADAADFNGDGKADILLQNNDGRVVEWQMNGANVASSTVVGSVGSGWHFADTGDFNGDHKADILWQNTNGQVAMWQMNGNQIASNTGVGSVGSGWSVANTGDYNHDGKADILWQNTNGAIAQWQMTGDHVDANVAVATHNLDWHIV
jgi:hypothetical protein